MHLTLQVKLLLLLAEWLCDRALGAPEFLFCSQGHNVLDEPWLQYGLVLLNLKEDVITGSKDFGKAIIPCTVRP